MQPAQLRVTTIAVILGACILLFFRQGRQASAPPNSTPAGAPSSDPSPPASPTFAREPERNEAATDQVAREPSSAPPDPGGNAISTSGAFPPDYTGIKDHHLLRLYNVFKMSLDRQTEILQSADDPQVAAAAEEAYLEASAYISLIQSQRLYYYGHTTPPTRPRNTNDAEYHLTGGGGMQVIFELTRSDFPDLFAAKDRRRMAERELENAGR